METKIREVRTTVDILMKPAAERNIGDVRDYLVRWERSARAEYDRVDAKGKLPLSVLESYYDSWSEADDAVKGLEGKAPVSKTISYLTQHLRFQENFEGELNDSAPVADFMGDKEEQRSLSMAMAVTKLEKDFLEQAIRLVEQDWEVRRKFKEAQVTP